MPVVLTLEGGGELTFALTQADLPVLREQIEEAMRIAENSRH